MDLSTKEHAPVAALPKVPVAVVAASTDISFSKLIVDIVQATDLPAECDAYAVIHFQGSAGETECAEQTRDPFWNTNFCFDVDADAMRTEEEGQLIVVTVLGTGEEEDEFLGEVSVLHCRYTVVALLLHYFYTVVTLLPHRWWCPSRTSPISSRPPPGSPSVARCAGVRLGAGCR
jgi:hypothetical protein